MAKKAEVFGGDFGKTPELHDWIWTLKQEPHASRRVDIKKAHPEVDTLMGHEPLTKFIVFGLVALQLLCAWFLSDKSLRTWYYWVIAYVIGGTVNQALFLAIHEVTHNLGFANPTYNRLLNLVSNVPIGLPYFAAFKGYHLEHHKYQGLDGVDTDLPTRIEAKLFNSTPGKLFFCIFQIFFYAIRPMAVRLQAFTFWHAANWVFQFTVMGLITYYWGYGAWLYLLISTFLAGSLHPCASHFIAEHYVFVEDWETYSYYGPLNWLTFNVGYHNEHHDFPNIPWSRLPALRKLAPEFYDNLPYHKSWPLVIWNFIFDNNVGIYNRVKRQEKKAQ